MSDFQAVSGFEEVWRPPVRTRLVSPREMLSAAAASAGAATRARLDRIAGKTPEVMVKVTGRTRDPGHLRAHLEYISRNGKLDLEGPDGAVVFGWEEVADLARDWATAAMADTRRRANSPVSLSVVLSMPADTNEVALRDAARAFAAETFGDRHDYVLALHTDTPRPHVHVSVASRGHDGERLNPKKADLDAWRQIFAQALRDHGVEAEATPRRARGVTLKPERTPLRKIRDRYEAGLGAPAQVRRSAYRDAAKAAFGEVARPVWETRTVERQAKVRGLYLAQAKVLGRSADPADQALGAKVEAFLKGMPQPDSQRLALARELRAANRALDGRMKDDDAKGGRER
jgi:type IV secretory pathway VirD2 relaxase